MRLFVPSEATRSDVYFTAPPPTGSYLATCVIAGEPRETLDFAGFVFQVPIRGFCWACKLPLARINARVIPKMCTRTVISFR